MSGSIEDVLVRLIEEAGPGRSVSPEQVARAAGGEAWRAVLPQVRATAIGLARRGRLAILRHGKPVDPDHLKGVYRLRAAELGDGG